MDAVAAPGGLALDPGHIGLSGLPVGATGVVVRVGMRAGEISAVERRLLELGFVSGERIEVLNEVRPGRDPIVVRVGTTTLAVRRRDVESVWIELQRDAAATDLR